MPHLGPCGGLSDSWLLRELGDLHWQSIAAALELGSQDIKDADGCRIYASFVRVRLEADQSLMRCVEGDRLALDYELQRFGDGMFFGNARGTTAGNAFHANLMSVFSRPGTAETETLVSSPPAMPGTFPSLPRIPMLATEYRAMKADAATTVTLVGERLTAGEGRDIQPPQRYVPNPYQAFNGARLLYFASYPAIADWCEASVAAAQGVMSERDWVSRTGLVARDIFYFANCEIGDAIDVSCQHFELSGRRVSTVLTLVRARDGQLMARVFSVKEIGA